MKTSCSILQFIMVMMPDESLICHLCKNKTCIIIPSPILGLKKSWKIVRLSKLKSRLSNIHSECNGLTSAIPS